MGHAPAVTLLRSEKMIKADRIVRTTCPYCGVGCQIDLHIVDDHIVEVTAPFDQPPNFGRLCVKGRFGTDFVHHPSRLRMPLIRRKLGTPRQQATIDGFRTASWDEALDLVASHFAEIKRKHGADAIATTCSAKATNEDNYLFQKYVRAVLGTNNCDHCARLCHAGSVAGLQLALGSAAMSNSVAEMLDLDTFLITGSNTAETHPVISLFLKKAVQQGGAKLIVADPRATEMTKFATIWLRHRAGTDVALFQSMANVIVTEKLYDLDFVNKRTEGFSAYAKAIQRYTPEWAEKITGVRAVDIRRAARMYAKASVAAIYWGMGISQSTHGTQNTLSLANLALLCGHLGKAGGGVNPLRGQNNVQGASDMGGLPNVFPGYARVDDPEAQAHYSAAWGSALLNPTPGLTVTEMVDGACSGAIQAFYIMGENPLMSEPHLAHARHCFENLPFLVHQDIFFNETSAYADVILPALSFAEKDGTFTNTDRQVQRVRKALPAPGQARPDWQIIADLGRRTEKALGMTRSAGWSYNHPAEIWAEIASLTPNFAGISYQRIDREGGIPWPCPTPEHPGTPYLFAESFPRGKGKFHALEYELAPEEPDAEYPFILSTGRVLYHWHGGTLTRRSMLDKVYPQATVEIHPDDAAKLGIQEGDMVRVRSRRGAIEVKALVTGRSPRGTVFVPFHFAEAAANELTIDAIDPIAKIPGYKICGVQVEALGA